MGCGGSWCDQTTPPFRLVEEIIKDAEGSVISLYPEVLDILGLLSQKGVPLAVASRTYSPEIARELMDLFGIRAYFQYEEIYPSSKVKHFESLRKRTCIHYPEMYFFDDEPRNVAEVGSLGVNAFLVKSGLNWGEVEKVPGLSRILPKKES